MQVILTNDYDKMSKTAATVIASKVISNPEAVLGLATGSTPIGTYKELIRKHKEEGLDFSLIKTVNLDEYSGLSGDHPQSYRYFMQDQLFNHINIDFANTYVPDATRTDIGAMCAEYEDNIERLGGVDIQLLGLGHTGHIGFNEPATYFPNNTHVVELNEITREANKCFFNSIDEVPCYAYTQGIGTIMRAREILLLVSGKGKHDILHKALFGNVTPEVPASILQFHPNVIVIVDQDAWNG